MVRQPTGRFVDTAGLLETIQPVPFHEGRAGTQQTIPCLARDGGNPAHDLDCQFIAHRSDPSTMPCPIKLLKTQINSPAIRLSPRLLCLLPGQRILTLLTTWQNKLIHTLQDRMVVYNLICKKNHQFEGWFPSFEDYQKQAEKKLISCPTCGSKRVEKMPHACAVNVKKEQTASPWKKVEQTAATHAP